MARSKKSANEMLILGGIIGGALVALFGKSGKNTAKIREEEVVGAGLGMANLSLERESELAQLRKRVETLEEEDE